jgi:hypothetical protein
MVPSGQLQLNLQQSKLPCLQPAVLRVILVHLCLCSEEGGLENPPSSSGESWFHLVGFDLKHILEELKGLLGGFRGTVWVEGRFLVQSREESGSHLSGA